jgi:hypothetical protein
MIADYFTKPLQGSIFKKFGDMIMNNYGNLIAPKSGEDRRSVLGNVQKAKGKGIVHDWKKAVHNYARTRGRANGHRRVVTSHPIRIRNE